EHDILDRCFHQMRGDLLRLGLDLVERPGDGAHADRAGTRAIGAHAELRLVSIAMNDLDLVDRYAEPGGNELCESRLVALAVTVSAGQHLDIAGRVDPHLGRLPEADARAERADRGRGRKPAGLDVSRKAYTSELTAPRRLRLARREALVVDKRQRLVERGFV